MAEIESQPGPNKDLKERTAPKVVSKEVSYFSLFKYTTGPEKLILSLAFALSILHGALMPLFSQLLGQLSKDFTPDKSPAEIRRVASKTAFYMFLVGIACFLFSSVAVYCWGYLGEKINKRVRKMYFSSMVGQELGWFDTNNPDSMTTRYIENMSKFEGAVGAKNHLLIMSYSMAISGFIIGFVNGWWFALIVLMSFPVQMIGMMVYMVVMMKESKVTKENYEEAGGLSEQSFGSIKTVKILVGETHEQGIYAKCIDLAQKASTRYGMISGASFGVFFMSVFLSYGINFWIGSVLVDRKVYNHNWGRDYNVADIISIFFAVTTGGFALGNTSPAIKALGLGRQSAHSIYETMERRSKIPLEDPKGIRPTEILGEIEFKSVSFRYPSLPKKQVLSEMSMKISKGQKVALVGETGCGKSTALQLIERYYDALEGEISIDGKDIKEYCLSDLRKSIGYVGQEPVLFAMSIKENILLAKPNATDSEIEDALRKANAYEFVMKLEKKLDTFVGTGGSQLSGGQKQRIAIARSIIQNPQILLLDEATSALDRKNEKEIQLTLDKLSKGRTTVTVAHRLSTIINSDIIYVFKNGTIAEAGKHEDLILKAGEYSKLVHVQLEGTGEKGLGNSEPFEKDPILMNDRELEALGAQGPVVQTGEEEGALKEKKTLTPEEVKKNKELEEKLKTEASQKMKAYLKGNYSVLWVGLVAACVSGSLMPLFAICLADMMNVLSLFELYTSLGYTRNHPDWEEAKSDAMVLGLYFIGFAGVAFLSNFFQLGWFNMLAQRISSKLRKDVYKHILTRDMEFFDLPANSPGQLSSVLAKDCLTVNVIVSTSYGAMVSGAASFVCGIVIAMVSSWRLGLVGLAVSPLIVLSGIVESESLQENAVEQKTEAKEAQTFQEVCVNMKTVSSLNAQKVVESNFSKSVEKENTTKISKKILSSVFYGVGQFGQYAVYAVTFYAGAEFTQRNGLSFRNLFRALFSIIFAAFGAGMSQQLAGNIGEAQKSARKIFKLLDTKNMLEIAEEPLKPEIKGKIEFRNVKFRYPTREAACLDGLSFTVEPNQKIAFAGPSGGGKSTIFSLLYRFYDPQEGEILVDGVDIKKIDLDHLRKSFGMVSQEPVLFNSTIEYNIKYNDSSITSEQIERATTIANAIGFIKGDKEREGEETEESDGRGFQRKVGLKGNKLSGGQKQRVAIARTVVRNPKVYFFDEATSALDTESERKVQVALSNISADASTLTIAHRVATIKDSDMIFVIEHGKVAEKGTFEELMKKKGIFFTQNSHNN